VDAFVHYNADKALMNLGYRPQYEDRAATVEPEIIAALTPDSSETHDFFSGSGSSYVIGRTEATDEDDWDF
jgi:ribonucleoside-diphosphate reductase beta chain